jgi:MFS family permease
MKTFLNFTTIAGIAFVGISPFYFYGALSVQIIEDLNYSPEYHGYGASAFYLIAAIFATTLGRVSDSTKPLATLRIALLVTLVSNFGIALSNSLVVMSIFLGVGGFANALATPGIARFVQQAIANKNQGLAYGIKQSATGISTLIGGAAIPFISGEGQWRLVFFTGAIFCLFMIFLVGNFTDKAYLARTIIKNIKERKIKSVKRTTYSLQVKFIGAGFGAGAAVGSGLVSYLALSNFEAGVSGNQAGLVLIYASIGSIVIRFAVLLLMDFTNLNPITVCAWMMLIGAVGIFGLATMNKDLVLISSIVSYTMGWGWVGLIGYKMLLISDTNLGTNTGLIQSTAAIGALFGPLVLSFVYKFSGFNAMWLVSGIGLILAMLLLLFSEKVEKLK